MVAADPGWPEDFAVLRDRITAALGGAALAVEHVGSTSVPGLPAKPVIDIDLLVADSADEPAWLPPLERAGFELVVREPWWQEHRALTAGTPRCNLHVFSPDAAEPVRHRLFRDWLREHPEDLVLYRDAKLGAAAESNAAGEHVMEYNARKEPVIRAIYDRAFRAAGSAVARRPVSQVMNRDRLFTQVARCVKRQIGFITWETGPARRPTHPRGQAGRPAHAPRPGACENGRGDHDARPAPAPTSSSSGPARRGRRLLRGRRGPGSTWC